MTNMTSEELADRDSNLTQGPNPNSSQPIWIQILRWIGVLPLAYFGGKLAGLLWWEINSRADYVSGGRSFVGDLILVLGSSALKAAAFVFIAAMVAPKLKKHVAVVAAGLLLVPAAGIGFSALQHGMYTQFFVVVFSSAGAVSAAFIVFYRIAKT